VSNAGELACWGYGSPGPSRLLGWGGGLHPIGNQWVEVGSVRPAGVHPLYRPLTFVWVLTFGYCPGSSSVTIPAPKSVSALAAQGRTGRSAVYQHRRGRVAHIAACATRVAFTSDMGHVYLLQACS
jgi:hypothetical protein